MSNPCAEKKRLREQLRERRRALGEQGQARAAEALTDGLAKLPFWPAANHCALYLPTDGEIATQALADKCRHLGQSLYLPVITEQKRLEFALWEPDVALVRNRYGINEPPPDAQRIPVSELDIIFLPLVGWDRAGGRLGMGGGYYDRSLAGQLGPQLVGLAHTCQEIPQVPRETWDVLLDYVVTDSGLHKCRPGA